MRKVAEQARLHFGSFDTWVNNAGVSIYGKVLEVPIEDQRRSVRDELLGRGLWLQSGLRLSP